MGIRGQAALLGFVLVTACGPGSPPPAVTVTAPEADRASSAALRFLLDDLTDQHVVCEEPAAPPWAPVTLPRVALGPVVDHGNGTRSRVVPVPLHKDEAGAPDLARWVGPDGSIGDAARILPSRRTILVADLEAFRQVPFWTSSDGLRLPLLSAPGEFPLDVERLGPETHATLTAGYGPGAGATRPSRPPELRILVGEETLARLVLPADGRSGDSVRFALPVPPRPLTLQVVHAQDRSGESLSLRSLTLEVADGMDRVVEPEALAPDARLEILPRAPRPISPFSGRPGTTEAVLTAVLAPGAVAVSVRRPVPFEVLVDDVVVAHSDQPVTELRFEQERLQVGRVLARSLGGPWPGPPVLVQPSVMPSQDLPGWRGQESSTPGPLDVRHLTLGQDSRRCLLVEPGTRVTFPSPLTGACRFEVDLGLVDLGAEWGGRPGWVELAAVTRDGGRRALGSWQVPRQEQWQAVQVEVDGSLTGATLELQVKRAEPRTLRARLQRVALSEPRLVDATAPRPPNVLVYLVDTLRADHLGCYGYPRATSPALDSLARDGILFEHASSQASWTKPSVATVFTGLIPSFHGVTRETAMPADATTLAEWLRQHGYQTAAFLSNPQVHAEGLNFEQGFGAFVALLGRASDPRSSDVNELALPWLREHRDRPFFLYLHTLDPHDPYDPPASTAGTFAGDYAGPLTPKRTLVRDLQDPATTTDEDLRHLADLYDEEILANDQEFGRVLEELKRLGLYEDTVILFLSDHGEEFRDHGRLGHGRTLYEECLHVPFVWKPAGADHPRGVRVRERVPLTSTFPTLAALVGHPLPEGMVQGRDVSSFWEEGGEDLPLVAEHRHHLSALVQDHKKVIENRAGRDAPVRQLFDLAADPREQRDLAGEHPDRAQALVELLGGLLARDRSRGLGREQGAVEVELTEEQKSQLRALGYLGDDG